MDVIIYHNPDCGTSRNTLGLIRNAGIEPHVIEYVKTPPSRALLLQLIARAGLTVRALLREKGTPYTELGLGDSTLSDDQLMDAMLAHPILINRPIVITPNGGKLCRPSDVVLDLLPKAPESNIAKEEGVPFLLDRPTTADDPLFAKALEAEGLPTADLRQDGRTFYVYSTLDGTIVGYGGYERLGENALVRSIAVLPGARNRGVGSNIVPLLLHRAHEDGARTAWLLTTSATRFFERLGFRMTARENAPDSILATHQAANLCPATATLLSRPISF